MAEVVLTVIKCLSWRAATGHRIHCGGSGHSTLSSESRPTTFASHIPGAWPPRQHISHLCICSQQHCIPSLNRSQLQIGESGSVWAGLLQLRDGVGPIHHVQCSGQCGQCMCVCVGVCVCALWEGSKDYIIFSCINTQAHTYPCTSIFAKIFIDTVHEPAPYPIPNK